ncbi:MAG: hypothetical protein U1F21_06850 [Sphaerotilus natans]
MRRTPATDTPQPKNNIVSGSPVRTQPQPVALGTVQAGPGASTRPIGRSAPMPPRHQPVGLPKIAATPGFVDSTTLLPSRGPQGAHAVADAVARRRRPGRSGSTWGCRRARGDARLGQRALKPASRPSHRRG